MKHPFLIIVSFIFFCACNKKTISDSDSVIARIGDHVLTEQDFRLSIPDNLNKEDSLILSESIIKTWIKDMLMYDLAKRNIQNKEAINQLVENYRKSLITYQYQEQLINEKMSKEISGIELERYYKENTDKFKLENILIQGLFLKIPVNAPQINKIKEWYKSLSVSDIENIEKYSIQNAVKYDYFYDRWVQLENVMLLFPYAWENPDALIRQKQHIEVQDSNFYYLLNIKEVLYPGETEPYEYTKSNVKEMIINQKRMDFMRNFEEELYQEAIAKGKVERIKN